MNARSAWWLVVFEVWLVGFLPAAPGGGPWENSLWQHWFRWVEDSASYHEARVTVFAHRRAQHERLVAFLTRPTVFSPQSPPTDTVGWPGIPGSMGETWGKCHGLGIADPGAIFRRYVHPDSSAGAVESPEAVTDSIKAHSSSECHLVAYRQGGVLAGDYTLDGGAVLNALFLGQFAGDPAAGSEGIKIEGTDWGELDVNSEHVGVMFHRMHSFGSRNMNLRDVAFFVSYHNSQCCSGIQGGNHVGTQANGDSSGALEDVTDDWGSAYDLVAWAHWEHNTLTRFGGGDHTTPPNYAAERGQIWRVVIIGPGRRCPMSGGGTGKAVQWICYNWSNAAAEGKVGNDQGDYLGGYVKAGPAQHTGGFGDYALAVSDCNTSYCEPNIFVRGLRASFTSPAFEVIPDDSAWEGSNRQLGCRDINSGGADDCTTNGDPVDQFRRASAPLTNFGPYDDQYWDQSSPSAIALSNAARDSLLDDVGVSRILNCYMEWVDVRDAFDSARIAELQAGTGLAEEPAVDTLSTPDPAAGAPCDDSDGDLVPDSAEVERGLDPGDPNDVISDADGDGMLCIVEIYARRYCTVFEDPWETNTYSATFGTGVNVYKCTSIDTVLIIQGNPPDTTTRRKCGGVGAEVGGFLVFSGDTVLLHVVEGTISGGVLMDSAEVDSFCASTGDCPSISDLRDAGLIPGASIIPLYPPKPEDPPEIEVTTGALKVA